MPAVAMILKRSPYGDINAAEAVRHALGAASSDRSVRLLLVDGGVLLAKKGQDDAGTGFTNLEATLRDCLDMGIPVYADGESLKAHRIGSEDLIAGVREVSAGELAGLMKEAKTTMIF